MRRPLSAAIVSSPVVGSSGYSRNRNCSGTASLGSPCAGGYSAHYTNNKRRSPPETPPTIPLAHQAFGEFKLFKEQQQATPMRLQMGQSRNIHSEIGLDLCHYFHLHHTPVLILFKVQLGFRLLIVPMVIVATQNIILLP